MVFVLHIPHSLCRSIYIVKSSNLILSAQDEPCYVNAKHNTYALCWVLTSCWHPCTLLYLLSEWSPIIITNKYKQKKATTYLGFIASSFCPKNESKVATHSYKYVHTNTGLGTRPLFSSTLKTHDVICLKKWHTWLWLNWNCTIAHSLHKTRRLIQKIKKTSVTNQIVISKTQKALYPMKSMELSQVLPF